MSESLDLGGIFAVADISTAPFDRKYATLVRQMSDLAVKAESASGGFVALDDGLVGVGESASKAATGLGRASKAATDAASAEQRAVQVAIRHAEAMARVNATLMANADESKAVQRASLQLLAAQDRLTRAQEGGRASAAQLAAAQSSVIGAEERLAAAQREAAAATTGLAASQREAVVASRGLAGGMAGTVRMAGELGLLFGAFEGVKKAIDITKQANEFQRSMVQVQTNADTSAAEVHRASAALLAMAGPVAAAPDQLATAWYHAKSVGLGYAKSIDTTRIAAEGARVGHADLEQTMNALTSTVASGIPGVHDMSSAMGQLIATVGSGDMKLSDLNQALGSGLLTVVKGYGLSLTDVGAALATFGDNNIRGADAATMLRMAVQAMAVPAKNGRAELESLGLSSNTLAKDMQTGGLMKAIRDLKNHLDDAGVSSTQVGAVLTEVFGKRAGPGLAVLIGQSDRLESKFRILRDSGTSFQAKWKATTQTASFALASLEHQAEAAGIALTGKLGPSIAAGARALGIVLPAAVHIAVMAAEPFVAVLHQVATVVGPLAELIGHVAGELHPVAPAFKVAAAGALSLYAAMKLLAGARVVGGLLAGGMARIGPAVLGANASLVTLGRNMRAVAAGERAMSMGAFAAGVAAAGFVVYKVGNQVANLVDKNNAFAHTIDNLHSINTSFTSVLQQTGGAIDANVRSTVALQLQNLGLAERAHKAGISLSQLTDAVTSGDTATRKLIDSWKRSGDPSASTTGSLRVLALSFSAAAGGARDLATVNDRHATPAAVRAAEAAYRNASSLGVSSAAYTAAQQAAKQNTDQTNAQTLAFQLENDAASLLQNALNGLAGINLSVATAQTGLASANLQVAAAFKQNGKAIDGSSAAAVANQQAIQGQVSAAQQYAEAVGKQTGSSRAAVAAFARSKTAIEDQLRAQGRLTPAVQAYIDKLYNLGNLKVPPTKLDADNTAAAAKVKALQDRIDAIRQGRVPGLTATSHDGERVIAGLQSEINNLRQHRPPSVTVDTSSAMYRLQLLLDAIPKGTFNFTVYENDKQKQAASFGRATGGTVHGPGSGTSDSVPIMASNGEEIINARQSAKHRALLKAINAGVGGFATGGTVGGAAGLARFASGGTVDTMQALAAMLRAMGATSAGIAGFLGNTKVESGGRLTAFNPRENAHGLQQWEGGRLTELKALARRMHSSITSRAVQLAMIKQELTHGYRDTLAVLRTAKSASSAAAYVDAHYERSSGDARSQREAAARTYYRQIQSGKLGTRTAAYGTGGKTGLTQVADTGAALAAYETLGKAVKLGRNPTKGSPTATIIADLQRMESALAKAGAPAAFVAGITKQNKAIAALAYRRNMAAAGLKRATAAVAAAVKIRSQDYATFKAAGVGSFDLTSAGVGENGRVTSGSLLAAQTQQVTKVRAWAAGMRKLIGSKIFPATYLRTLLGAGPSSLPTVQALLGMSVKDLKAFANNEKSIAALSGEVASAGAHKLDDPAVNAARRDEAAWARREAALQRNFEKAVDRVGDRVAAELSHLNVESKLHYKSGDLYIAVVSDQKRSKHRGATR